MKKLLYGDNIIPACKYCIFGNAEQSRRVVVCKKRKKDKRPDDRCIRFRYDPLLRIPEPKPVISAVTEDDLILSK